MNRKHYKRRINSALFNKGDGKDCEKEKNLLFKIKKSTIYPLLIHMNSPSKKDSQGGFQYNMLMLFLFCFLFLLSLTGTSSALVEVHIDYDWWEPSVMLEAPPEDFASCAACHETLGVPGGVHPSLRKYCEDCHLPGRSGPFVYYEAASLYRSFNYSAPTVYNHIINASNNEIYYEYSGDIIEVEDQSKKYGGNALSSCFGWNPETGQGTCHGISEMNQVDGSFGFSLTENDVPARQDPYLYALDVTSLPDTTDCLYCHAQDNQTIVVAWGGATQVNSSHFGADEKEDCYRCHVDESVSLTTFHKMGPEPKVIFIAPPSPTPSPPPPTQTPPPTTLPPTTLPPQTTIPPEITTSTTIPPTTLPPETTIPPTPSNIYKSLIDSIKNLLQRLWCIVTQSC